MLLASAASSSVSATDEALGKSEEFRLKKRTRLESFDSVSH